MATSQADLQQHSTYAPLLTPLTHTQRTACAEYVCTPCSPPSHTHSAQHAQSTYAPLLTPLTQAHHAQITYVPLLTPLTHTQRTACAEYVCSPAHPPHTHSVTACAEYVCPSLTQAKRKHILRVWGQCWSMYASPPIHNVSPPPHTHTYTHIHTQHATATCSLTCDCHMLPHMLLPHAPLHATATDSLTCYCHILHHMLLPHTPSHATATYSLACYCHILPCMLLPHIPLHATATYLRTCYCRIAPHMLLPHSPEHATAIYPLTCCCHILPHMLLPYAPHIPHTRKDRPEAGSHALPLDRLSSPHTLMQHNMHNMPRPLPDRLPVPTNPCLRPPTSTRPPAAATRTVHKPPHTTETHTPPTHACTHAPVALPLNPNPRTDMLPLTPNLQLHLSHCPCTPAYG